MMHHVMWNRRTDQSPLVKRGGCISKCVLYLEPVVDDTPVDVEQEGRSVAARPKGRVVAGKCVLVWGVYFKVCYI